ncbi:MAG: 4a-hydroxytetrahydrobiopterin dehydratase [Salinisphaera sp.]|nr:4a-hydroxytetrahydrobiopterin dehydratase [Salinisphaera sp.]
MDGASAQKQLQTLSSNWTLDEEGHALRGEFTFKNYYRTSAFVNAVVWIAHREDHHPDISFGYKNCTIHYSTHAIGGLSDNDFICAAKVDELT